MDLSLIFLSLSIAISAFVHAAFGFGFPMLATPLLALQSNVQYAILLTLFPTSAVNIITMLYRRNGGPSIFQFLPLAFFSVIGTLIGTQMLINFSPEPFRLFLAMIIGVYLFKEKLIKHQILWLKQHLLLSMIIFGLIAGLVSGTTNIMIPVLLIYLTELEVERVLMIRVMNLCFFSAKITQVGQFALVGLLDQELMGMAAILTTVAIFSIFIGFRFQALISDQLFHRLLRLILYIMAISLIVQFIFWLIGH